MFIYKYFITYLRKIFYINSYIFLNKVFYIVWKMLPKYPIIRRRFLKNLEVFRGYNHDKEFLPTV